MGKASKGKLVGVHHWRGRRVCQSKQRPKGESFHIGHLWEEVRDNETTMGGWGEDFVLKMSYWTTFTVSEYRVLRSELFKKIILDII